MASEIGRFTRATAVVAVFVAVMFLATPVLQLGGRSVSTGVTGNAAAANGSRVLNIGLLDYQSSVSTLNPYVYTMSNEYTTFEYCYDYLLTYDLNGNRVGDLATSWSVSPNGTVWHFTIANNAHFVDPTNPSDTSHSLTDNDVFWSYWECANDSGNHLSSYFLNGNLHILKNMWQGTSPYDFYIQTTVPYGPFLGALTVIPIVPKYIWNNLPHGTTPLTFNNLPPIGSGPLYYGNGNSLPGAQGVLKRNPIWFNEANRGWQMHVDTVNLKSYSDLGTAWLDLSNPTAPPIDVLIDMDQSTFIANLANGHTTPHVIGWAQSTGFMYEYQLNQLTTLARTQLENANLVKKGGSNNQLMLDPTVKLALAMCVNKPQFIQDVVSGLGTVADSLVPDCNPWHYDVPNPVQFNPAAARTLLNNAGWTYDTAGNFNPNALPLCKAGGTSPLSFNIFSLNTEPNWQLGANDIVAWAAQAGVQYSLSLQTVNAANTLWYQANYDAWLWDWVFSPVSDPSTDCAQVDTTMAIGTWSGSYWSNSTYDALYNRSLFVSDPAARRVLTNELQQMLYDDHADQLVAYRQYCYGASTVNWDGSSYGNWTKHWELMPDQGLPWLFMQISPVGNLAPTVSVSQSGGYSGLMNSPISFSGSSSQTSNIQYQWYWGDGTVSGWLSSASTTHTYTKDGVYTAYFAAKQTTGADLFSGWNQTTVTVVDASNLPPVFGSTPISESPSSGISTATNITFTGSATDPNGDPIYYSWNFGDTYTATGTATPYHQYLSPGTFTVTLTVTDNRAGSTPQVATTLIPVLLNHPPVVSLPSGKTVLKSTLTTFTASASDPDSDPIRLTWIWGDGATTVTTAPSATHTYSLAKSYTLTLWVNDLTGLPGHNVSASMTVKVVTNPTPPFGVTLSGLPLSIWATQSVAFSGSAQDPAGDPMQFTFTFGDGNSTVINNNGTANNAVVTDTPSHVYNSAGTMTATMTASDGLTPTTSTGVIITVTLNHMPVLTAQTTKNIWPGNTTSFSASATDADGETIRYTWNFGDGSPLVVAKTTTHSYTGKAGIYNYTVYADDLTGLAGHNVTSTSQAKLAFTLPLVTGWNLVSVPLVGNGYKASTLKSTGSGNPGLMTGDLVASWNSATQTYSGTYIVGISPPSSDFTINKNVGYWIWVAASRTLHLYGYAPYTTQMATVNVPSAGWVSLGFESQNTTWHARDVPAMYSGAGAITVIASFNPTTKAYKTWLAAVPTLNNFLIVPGQAYWCWVTASGTITYAP